MMIYLDQIREVIDGNYFGDLHHVFYIKNVSTISDAEKDSLIWIKNSIENKQELIDNTLASIIIIPFNCNLIPAKGKVLIEVKNPRLTFIKVIEKFFVSKTIPGINPTAFIHPEAIIDPTSFIGPFCYIGKSTIGKNTCIFGNVHIYDNVKIGNNVNIHAGTVIGADGFGYERGEDGVVYKFPHIGGVVIEDGVEIGSNTCIDKGTLGDTLIKYNAKIDNLVHIAHNVEVGANTFVIANAMVGGSTKIGESTWIAPSVSLMNGISIGSNATIGMASLVTKNVPDGMTWTGFPAKPLSEFLELQSKLKKL